MYSIENLKNRLIGENGYIEKKKSCPVSKLYEKSNSYDGSDNYTKYWQDCKDMGLSNYQGSYYCIASLFWGMAKEFGLSAAQELTYQNFMINCQTTYNLFKKKGRVYSNPQVGDIVVFWNGSRFSHAEFVTAVQTSTYTTVGFNTTANSTTVSRNGGGVKYPKKYSIYASKNAGHKFLRPDYGSQIQTGWVKKDNGKWQYVLADGTIVKNKWYFISDRWYVFNGSGEMITGWYHDSNGQWYYMNGDGSMSQYNWVQDSAGKWYYTSADGTLHTGWLQEDDTWYLLGEDGVMLTGWQKVNGKWYVLQENGKMLHDTWFLDGSTNDWYYLSSSGDMKTSRWIQQDDGNFYYVKEDGKMAKYCYIKDEYKDVYYWVDNNGVYLPEWDTTNPDLNKYQLVK